MKNHSTILSLNHPVLKNIWIYSLSSTYLIICIQIWNFILNQEQTQSNKLQSILRHVWWRNHLTKIAPPSFALPFPRTPRSEILRTHTHSTSNTRALVPLLSHRSPNKLHAFYYTPVKHSRESALGTSNSSLKHIEKPLTTTTTILLPPSTRAFDEKQRNELWHFPAEDFRRKKKEVETISPALTCICACVCACALGRRFTLSRGSSTVPRW